MVAMVIIGMSNLGWVVTLAGLVLVYKLGPAPSVPREVVALGGSGRAGGRVRI
jgi:hypothetical protein